MNFTRGFTFCFTLAVLPALLLAGCHIKQTGLTDKVSLHKCLDKLRGNSVDDAHCGNLKWFMKQTAWVNGPECYNRCTACLSSAIDAGATHVSCGEKQFLAHCHVGFYA